MGERYSEAAIYRQNHDIPLSERRQMVEGTLATIDPYSIRRVRSHEMTSTLMVEGLTFIWRAWKISFEMPDTFLDDDKGPDKLIGGINHWMPHAPYIPEHRNGRLQKQYSKFMQKRDEDPVIRRAISTAIVAACMRKEQ